MKYLFYSTFALLLFAGCLQAADVPGIVEFKQKDRRFYRAFFSPDSTNIVIVSDDKTARIWDAESGRELYNFPGTGVPRFGIGHL